MFIECREEVLPTQLAEDINATGLLKSEVTTPLNTTYPAIKYQGRVYSVRKGDWAEVTPNGLMVIKAGRIIQNEQHDYDSELQHYTSMEELSQWVHEINARYFPESDIRLKEHQHGYVTLSLDGHEVNGGEGDVFKLDRGKISVMSNIAYRCQFTNQGIKCVLGARHSTEEVMVMISNFNQGKREEDKVEVSLVDGRIALRKNQTTFVMQNAGILFVTDGIILNCRKLPC